MLKKTQMMVNQHGGSADGKQTCAALMRAFVTPLLAATWAML